MATSAAPAHARIPSSFPETSAASKQESSVGSGVWLPVFQFRNGFWANLHHFLYLQARLADGYNATNGGRPAPLAWAAASLSGLSPAERREWERAVDYYAKHFANYDLPHDSFLVRVNDRLSDIKNDCPDLSGKNRPACYGGIDPPLTAVLEAAAPVYRAHWWPEQKRVNEAWIAQAAKLVHEYGGKPAQMLASAFNNTWPPDPIPVDVVLYAGPYGAYTTLGPLHVTISSVDPLNAGPAALEAVFRESSHAIAAPVEQAIVSESQKETKVTPRDLWHALTAYTTARVFEQAFANPSRGSGTNARLDAATLAAGARAYVSAHGWQGYDHLLQLYWQPYLDGQTGVASAVEDLVYAQ